MNEQQNVEIVKSLYAAFHEGNIKHVIDSVHENVVWHTPGPDIVPYSGTVNGKDGVTKFFQALAETQTDMKLTADEFVAQGDRVVMRGRYEATVRQTGKRFDAFLVHFFTVQDGVVMEFLDYGDTHAVADAYTGSRAVSA